ncbi:MAG: NAD(P)-dependent oxidoreductase [Pseudomonadota bacterium]
MKVLVTGSAGHLGEALMRVLGRETGMELIGLDIKPSRYTTHVGSITDASVVAGCMQGADAVYHTATLHKPHVATHTKSDFIETNITGTLTLLESAVSNGVTRFVFTSTTSTFGDALRPPPGQPSAWKRCGSQDG